METWDLFVDAEALEAPPVPARFRADGPPAVPGAIRTVRPLTPEEAAAEEAFFASAPPGEPDSLDLSWKSGPRWQATAVLATIAAAMIGTVAVAAL